jgi:hypothetical protein
MKTAKEVEQLLDEKLPDGPESDYAEGAQDMALWILGRRREDPFS